MGQWNDRIRSHAVWEALKALGPAIDQASAKEGLDASAIDNIMVNAVSPGPIETE